MSALLVDSHCHLNLLPAEGVAASTDEVLAAAAAQGVGYFLCVSVDLHTVGEVLALARTYSKVFASVGVHPNHDEGQAVAVEDLVSRAADPRVVAIGETGLDYFRVQGDIEWQRQRFRDHIAAARLSKKPLIVHCRDAKDDTLRILEEEDARDVGGVMHCFVEDWETARRAMDMNFLISFSGIVTFKSAEPLRQVAKQIPADFMLVETDSPYLAPVPHRGKVNQPAYVRHVAEAIALLRDESFERLAQQTTDNFFRLFAAAQR